jgi:transcriptional regulator with XRE-family HTH domain
MSRSKINHLIGARLKRWRKGAALTQIQVAGRADIPQSAISQWENGESSPGGENLSKLQNAFPNFDMAWVVSGKLASDRAEGSQIRLEALIGLFTDQVAEEMVSYGDLSPDEIEALRQLLRVLKSGHKDASQLVQSALDAATEIIKVRGDKTSIRKRKAKKK